MAGEFEVFLRRASRRYANVTAATSPSPWWTSPTASCPTWTPDWRRSRRDKLRRRGIDLRLGTSVRAVGAGSRRADRRHPPGHRHGDLVRGHRPQPGAGGTGPAPGRPRLGAVRARPAGARTPPRVGHRRLRGQPRTPTARPTPPPPRPRCSKAGPWPTTWCGCCEGRTYAALHGSRNLGRWWPWAAGPGVARVGPFKLAGFTAWFLWRSVYLLKMPGWGRRFRVALEWTIDLLFGRDDVQLGVRGEPRAAVVDPPPPVP